MRKLKLLLVLCLVAITASASKTVYFQPNSNWAGNTTRYSLYLFTGDNAGPWLDFTAVGETGVYSATISDEQESWESMIICAMDKNTTGNSWDDKWNQSNNLAVAPVTGLLYTQPADVWDNFDCSVSIYGATAASFTDGGKYLFKNVGSGKYLGPANSWGTQASLIASSHFNTIHAANGKYTIESQVSNGGTNYYFTGSYMDGGAANVTIVEAGEGVYNMWNGATFYGYNGSSTVLSSALTDRNADNAKWQIIPVADALNNATMDNPVDATYLILDANFDRNNRYGGGGNNDLGNKWKMVASNQNLCGGNTDNCNAESWHSTFTLSQTIENVPNGIYELTAQGFYRQDGSDNDHLPYFYINNGKQTFPLKTGSENSMGNASVSFSAGQYTITPIRVTVTDGTITLGAKNESNTSLWCIFDNFTLKYYGVDLEAYNTTVTNLRTELNTLLASPMNATVKSNAQTVYNETASVEQTTVALETAIATLNTTLDAVNASIALYAEIAELLNAASIYDSYGQASYAANETVAAIQAGYNNGSIEAALTNEQKSAAQAALIVACKAQKQPANGCDMTVFIVNPGIDGNTDGWTTEKNGSGYMGGPLKPSNDAMEFWGASTLDDNAAGKSFDYYQMLTDLPTGAYTISASLLNSTNGEEGANWNGGGNAGVYGKSATDEKIALVTIDSEAFAPYTTEEVLVVDGALRIGVKNINPLSGRWFACDNFKLTYARQLTDEEKSTIAKAGYDEALAAAKTAAEQKMAASVLAQLNSAISTYDEDKVENTESAYLAATTALNAATEDANASIDNYAQLFAAINSLTNSYTAAFEAGTTLFNDAVTAAQAVYDAAEVTDCTAAITALTNGVHAAYESDYATFANDYEYDYSTLLSNDLTKWATSNYVVMEGTEHWNGLTGQRYYEQSSSEWGSSAWNHAASETAVLPAGKYVMSITARAAADVTSTMSVKIGDNDAVVVPLPHKGSVGRGVTTAGEGSFADGTYANNNNGRGWEYRFIAFELAEESSVTISFNSSTNKQYNWVSIASPLLKGNVHPNQIKLNQVHTLTATLKGYEGSISAETYATFADNIAAAEAATLESANLDAIITALTADVETAKAEKVIFDRGAAMNALNTGDNSVVLTEEATAANWTPTPTLNTWSTEADNTGMVKPFLQNWKSKNDGALADNTETYVPIRGLKKGYYEVSALVRIYSESGAEPSATSAIFTVNGKSVSLLDGTNFVYNNMKGIYNTVRVVVYTEDALNISLAYEGANFNWIAWKNLKVTYLTENANPVYAVAGSAPFFSGSWDQTTQADILTEESEGVYTKTYANQILDAQTIEYKVVKKDLLKATHATAWYPNDNQTISIPVKGKYNITITFNGNEESPVVTGEATKVSEAVTISDKRWATTVTNSPLDFSGVTEFDAYTATVADSKVVLTKVDNVQAETGLVLRLKDAVDPATFYVPLAVSSSTPKGSLKHSSTATYDTWHNNGGENNKFYGLYVNGEGDAQFTLINCSAGNEVTIPAQKAFLLLNNGIAQARLEVVFDDETTGISTLNTEDGAERVYNLNGQRVNAPSKGLYIVNGKKVVIK